MSVRYDPRRSRLIPLPKNIDFESGISHTGRYERRLVLGTQTHASPVCRGPFILSKYCAAGLLLQVHEPEPHCGDDRFGAVLYTQLCEEALDAKLDGILGQEKCLGDLFVATAFNQ